MIRVFAALLLVSGLFPSENALADQLDLLFFPYESPESSEGQAMWQSAISAVQNPERNFDVHLVLNPGNGPGDPASDNRFLDQNGEGLLKTFVENGGLAYGYIKTEFGQRGSADVQGDVVAYRDSKYSSFLSGYFFDEMANDVSFANYYSSLDSFVKTSQSEARTFGNPGNPYINDGQVAASNGEVLVNSLDTIINAEYTIENYLDPNVFQPNAAYSGLEPDQIGHIVHTNASWDSSLLGVASSRGAGLLYVTDDIFLDQAADNPYDRTPTYWNQFVDDVIAFNAVPEPSSAGAICLLALAAASLRRRNLVG